MSSQTTETVGFEIPFQARSKVFQGKIHFRGKIFVFYKCAKQIFLSTTNLRGLKSICGGTALEFPLLLQTCAVRNRCTRKSYYFIENSRSVFFCTAHNNLSNLNTENSEPIFLSYTCKTLTRALC